MLDTKELCPICAKTELGPGTGFSKEPCEKCKEYKAMGFVLIGAVEAKTSDATSPYRSGNIWVVKEEVAVSLFGKDIPKSGVAFIDVTVAQQMGLPGVNLNA